MACLTVVPPPDRAIRYYEVDEKRWGWAFMATAVKSVLGLAKALTAHTRESRLEL